MSGNFKSLSVKFNITIFPQKFYLSIPFWTLLLFFSSSSLLSAQNNPSLERAEQLFQQKEYKEMLEALFQMGRSNSHTANWDETLLIFERLEVEAKRINNPQMIGQALDAQTSLLQYFKRMEEAENKILEMLTIQDMSDDLYSNAYNRLGNIYTTNGELEKGYAVYMKAFKIDSTNRDSSSLPFLLASIANNLEFQGKYSEAIKTYLQAISTVPAKDSFKFTTFNFRLGVLFLDIGNYSKASAYFNEALQLATRMKHKSARAKCLLYLGHVASRKDNHEVAKEYYLSALKQFEKRSNPEFEFYAINGLGALALKNNDLTATAEYLKRAESYLEKLEGKHFKNSHLNNRLAYQLKIGNLKKAKPILEEVLASTKDFEKINFQITAFELAQDYFHQQGNYRLAYLYKNKFQVLKDSITEVQKSAQVHTLEAQYQKAEQDLAIAKLDVANKEKTELLNRQNRTIIFGGLGLLTLSLLGGMGIYLYQTKRKTAEELSDKNNIITSRNSSPGKEQFASHFFPAPITIEIHQGRQCTFCH